MSDTISIYWWKSWIGLASVTLDPPCWPGFVVLSTQDLYFYENFTWFYRLFQYVLEIEMKARSNRLSKYVPKFLCTVWTKISWQIVTLKSNKCQVSTTILESFRVKLIQIFLKPNFFHEDNVNILWWLFPRKTIW